MKIIIHTISFLLSFSIGFTQNSYFVAMQGDNANPGTFDQPWQTIQYAVDKIISGDTVNIIAGLYSEQIRITKSGKSNSPIVIRNFDNDLVSIDAGNNSFGIIVSGCQHVVIHGLTIFGAQKKQWANEQCNLYLQNSPSYITIQGCDIYDGQYGIFYNGGESAKPKHISIIDCRIHDNQLQGINVCGFESGSGDSIVISGNDIYRNGYDNEETEQGAGIKIRADNSIIQDNQIYDNAGYGLLMDRLYYPSNPVHWNHCIVRKNKICNNGYSGILIDEQYHHLIYENDIHNNGMRQLGQNSSGQHGIYVAQTLNCIFFNNEIYNQGAGSAIRLEGNFNVIQNNHFFNNGIGIELTDAYGETYGNIIRKNRIHSGTKDPDGWPSGSGIEADGTKELYLYNNVFVNNSAYGTNFIKGHHSYSSGLKLKNNMYINTGWEIIYVEEGNENGYAENYNNIYPDKPDAIKISGTHYWFVDYKSSTGQGLNSISKNPNFISITDFHLASDSPCINAGGFLTTTTTEGSGTQIEVQDVLYFSDGYSITAGDLIQLEGQTETAQITEIDYQNNILLLDRSLSWTKGQGVSLPYDGTAPDIGVFEFTNAQDTTAPSPPQNVKVQKL